MNYAPRLAPRAQRGLEDLDLWLQEETLDEIERLVEISQSSPLGGRSELVHDFVRHFGGLKHYVFIWAERDDVAQILEVREIGHFAKPVRFPHGNRHVYQKFPAKVVRQVK